MLRCPDEELLELLGAAYRVRRRHFGNRVHLNFLINAKSGRCGEDCGYCSQSRVSTAPIEKYDLLEPGKPDSIDRGGVTYLLSPNRMMSKNAYGQANMACLAEISKWEV